MFARTTVFVQFIRFVLHGSYYKLHMTAIQDKRDRVYQGWGTYGLQKLISLS